MSEKRVSAQQMCILGVGRTITSCFGLSNPALFTQITNPIFQRAARAKNKNIKYPICYYAVSSISRDTGFAMKGETKRPVVGAVDDSGQVRYSFGVVRVLYRLKLVFITNQEQAMYDFIGKWFFAKSGMGQRLNFDANYYGTKFPVLVHAMDELTVPNIEYDEERPMHYEFEGELEMHGFVTNVNDERDFSKEPILQQQQRIQGTVISHIGDQVTVESEGDSPIILNFYMGDESDYPNRGQTN